VQTTFPNRSRGKTAEHSAPGAALRAGSAALAVASRGHFDYTDGPLSRSLATRCFAAAVAVLAASSPAGAESGLDLELAPAPAGDRGLLVPEPDAPGARLLSVRLLSSYARAPLVLTTPQLHRHELVSHQLWLHAAVSVALFHRLLLSADLPYLADSAGYGPVDMSPTAAPAPTSQRSLGDVRMGARFRLFGSPSSPEHIGIGADVWLPTGKESAYAGDGAVRGQLYAAVGGRRTRSVWSVQLGALLRGSDTLPSALPTRSGSAIVLGAMSRFAVDPHARFEIGPELSGRFVIGNGGSLFDPRSTQLQLLVAARFRPFGNAFELGGGFGPSLGQGAGSADLRVLGFLGWAPVEPPPPPDRDNDGVPDSSDTCTSLPGVAASDPVMNGCPALPLDTDSDSIPDAFDACPRQAGKATQQPRTHGCPPAPDRDGDNVPDEQDACPDTAGVAAEAPTQHGCPAQAAAAELVGQRIEISEQIQFETGTAILRATSAPILAEIAQVLREHPEVQKLEVQGHTDDTGTRERNQLLSEARARAVAEWLQQHGVEKARLLVRGFGQTQPLSDNASEAGRARNRRVEFRVLSGPQDSGEKP